MIYPIAETFHSIQGEGVWTGTPMHFIRLAGCNVGEYRPTPISADLSPLQILRHNNPQHSICTGFNGTEFLCDTDYHKHEMRTPKELFEDTHENHICITGGEPFIHDLSSLIETFRHKTTIHIETSGTKPLNVSAAWITCSPKKGFLRDNRHFIDEWKFVVDAGHIPFKQMQDIDEFLEKNGGNGGRPVYLTPVNNITAVRNDSLTIALAILEMRPQWRLSAQLHKYLGVR